MKMLEVLHGFYILWKTRRLSVNDVAKKYVLMKLDADFLERKLIHCTKGKFLVVGILHLLDL